MPSSAWGSQPGWCRARWVPPRGSLRYASLPQGLYTPTPGASRPRLRRASTIRFLYGGRELVGARPIRSAYGTRSRVSQGAPRRSSASPSSLCPGESYPERPSPLDLPPAGGGLGAASMETLGAIKAMETHTRGWQRVCDVLALRAPQASHRVFTVPVTGLAPRRQADLDDGSGTLPNGVTRFATKHMAGLEPAYA